MSARSKSKKGEINSKVNAKLQQNETRNQRTLPPIPLQVSELSPKSATSESLRGKTATEESDRKDVVVTERIPGKYSKRTVICNWDKYHLPPNEENDDDDVTDRSRGADFSQLIHSTGTYGNLFQFSQEKDWEKIDFQETFDLVRLDLQELSLAVRCVPVPDRLMLDKELFKAEELDEFQRVAEQNLKHYYTLFDLAKSLPEVEITSVRAIGVSSHEGNVSSSATETTTSADRRSLCLDKERTEKELDVLRAIESAMVKDDSASTPDVFGSHKDDSDLENDFEELLKL